MRKRFDSLRSRLLLLFCVALLAIGLPTYLYIDNVYFQRTIAERGIRLQNVATTVAAMIQEEMHARRRDIVLLAEAPFVTDGNAVGQVGAALERMQRTYPRYSWIGMTDAQGKVTAATGGLLEGVNVSARGWFVHGSSDTHIGDLHEALLLSKLLGTADEELRFIDFAAPVRRADGSFAGVVASHVHWGWVSDIIGRVASPSSLGRQDIFIFNKQGVQIYPQNKKAVTLPEGIAGQKDFAVRTWPDGIRYGTAIFNVEEQNNGEPIGWQVIVRRPLSVMTEGVRELQRTMLFFVAGAGVVLLLLLFWGVTRISRPIGQVARFAQRIEQGDEDVYVAIAQEDREVREVRHMIQSVRGMAGTLTKRRRELEESNAHLEAKVAERTAELDRLKKEAESQARTDPLTGLLNRRGFGEAATQVISAAQRSGMSLTMVMLDIDHFKRVNDTWGHEAGDVVLKAVAKALAGSCRASDITARLGGEEFAVLLADTDVAGARLFAETLRQLIESMAIEAAGTTIRVTSSFGLAAAMPGRVDIDDMLRRSDAALYFSKTHGRNRVSDDAEVTTV